MGSFSTINTGDNLQARQYLNEIESALTERMLAVGGESPYWEINDPSVFTWGPPYDGPELRVTYDYWTGTGWTQRFREHTGYILSGGRVIGSGGFQFGPVRPGSVTFTFQGLSYSPPFGYYDDDGNGVITARIIGPDPAVGAIAYGNDPDVLGIGATQRGDNIQGAAFWKARQEAVRTIVDSGISSRHHWLDLGSYGNPPSGVPSYVDATPASIDMIASVNEIWIKVTNGQTRPRRRVTMSGYPSSGWLYGYCQAGDIIQVDGSPSPWLIEDLQDACRFMYATVNHCEGAFGGVAKRTHRLPYNVTNDDYAWFGRDFVPLQYAGAADDHDHGTNHSAPGDDTYVDATAPISDESFEYMAEHVAAWQTVGLAPFRHTYASSEQSFGLASIETYPGISQKAAMYFVTATPDPRRSWDGPYGDRVFFRDYNGALEGQVSAAGNMYRAHKDANWVNRSTLEVIWNRARSESYFDQTTPISATSRLGPTDWYGYKLLAEHYTTLEWDWTYN